MIKKSILVMIFCCLAFIVASVAMMMHFQRVKSQPRLIEICHINDVVGKCPEILFWIKARNSWEWVPDDFLPQIISYPLPKGEIVFATYEMEIRSFKPYSFHSTKGEFEISQGSNGYIYIYAWDKRYKPMISP
ncbi:MAG: hypothetical protein IKH04_06885 [Kiritimatiellae bacterium]|nr:hypothetical protein [Kiritimatiellia bacterium]